MSKMSRLFIIIEEMLAEGDAPEVIAEILEVPVSWVYECARLRAIEDDGL